MGGCRHVLSFLTASRLLTALRQGAVTGLIAAFGALGYCPGGCRTRPAVPPPHRLVGASRLRSSQTCTLRSFLATSWEGRKLLFKQPGSRDKRCLT